MSVPSDLMLRGLEGSRLVRTPVFDEIEHALSLTIPLAGGLAVAGPPGCGKRVATLSTVADRAEPHVQMALKPKMSVHDLIRSIYNTVHSDRDVYELSAMQDDLAVTMKTAPGILVVQQCEYLSSPLAGTLHYLLDHPGNQWSFVLLGGTGTARAAARDANLRGDIIQTVQVRPLKDESLWRFVRGVHPFFTHAEQRLLTALNKAYGKGLPKRWARLLQIALTLQRQAVENGKEPPHLNDSFARLIVSRIPRLEHQGERALPR